MDHTRRYCRYNKIKTKIKKNQKKEELKIENATDSSEAKYKLDRFIADVKRYAEKVKRSKDRRRRDFSSENFLNKKGIFENAIIGKPQLRGDSHALLEQNRLNAARLKGDLNSLVEVKKRPLSQESNSSALVEKLNGFNEEFPSIVENPININKLLATPSSAADEENDDPGCPAEEKCVPFSPPERAKTSEWLLFFNKKVSCSDKSECTNSKIETAKHLLAAVGNYVLDASKKLAGNYQYTAKKNILSKIESIVKDNSCVGGDNAECCTCCLENLWEKPEALVNRVDDPPKPIDNSPKLMLCSSKPTEPNITSFPNLDFLSKEPDVIDLTEDLEKQNNEHIWDFIDKRIEDPTPQQLNLNQSFLIPSPRLCKNTPKRNPLESENFERSFFDSIDVRLKELSSNIESKLQDVLNDDLDTLSSSMNTFLSPIPKPQNYVESPFLLPDIPKQNEPLFSQRNGAMKKLEAFDTPYNETFQTFHLDIPSTSQTVIENNNLPFHHDPFSYKLNTSSSTSQNPPFFEQRKHKRKDSTSSKYFHMSSKYDLKNSYRTANKSLNVSFQNYQDPFHRKRKDYKRFKDKPVEFDRFNLSESTKLLGKTFDHSDSKSSRLKSSLSQSFIHLPSPSSNLGYPLSPIEPLPVIMDTHPSQTLLTSELEFPQSKQRRYNLWKNKKLFSPHNF